VKTAPPHDGRSEIEALRAIWRPASTTWRLFQSDVTPAAVLHTHKNPAVAGGFFALIRK
jgi:hypothetical protein